MLGNFFRTAIIGLKGMTERKLTDEEYEAQGMLLGLSYDRSIHTFYDPLFTLMKDDEELDADTLEPLKNEEINRRVEAFRKEKGWDKV